MDKKKIESITPLRDWVLIELGPKWLDWIDYLGENESRSPTQIKLISMQHPMIETLRVGTVVKMGPGLVQSNGEIVFPCPGLKEKDKILYNESGVSHIVPILELTETDLVLIRASDIIAKL